MSNPSIIRARGIKLFEEPNVSEIEHPVLGTRPVFLGVLAEILELVEGAEPQGLSEEEKEPVDSPLLFIYYGLHAVRLVAEVAVKKARNHPQLGRPVVHGVLVAQEIGAQREKTRLQIDFPRLLPVTSLAHHLAADAHHAMAQQIIQRPHHGSPVSGPRVGRHDPVILRPGMSRPVPSTASSASSRSRGSVHRPTDLVTVVAAVAASRSHDVEITATFVNKSSVIG